MAKNGCLGADYRKRCDELRDVLFERSDPILQQLAAAGHYAHAGGVATALARLDDWLKGDPLPFNACLAESLGD